MTVENLSSESTLSAREYVQYKLAMQDFSLSVVYATNILHGNPFKAVTARPFERLSNKNIEGQLVLKKAETALTDGFFKFESLFHSLLGNHDTARSWAQHVNWPFTRFDTLLVVASSERENGKFTKETVQSARESLDQVPIIDTLKPKLAMAWAHLAPFAQDIDKQPAVCIDTSKFILGSLHQEVTVYSEDDDIRSQDEKINRLAASVSKAYLAVAETEGKFGLNFQMSLRLAQEFGQKVFDTERSIELLLRSALTKKKLRVEFTDDIDKAKEIVMNMPDREYKHETLLGYLITIAETELATVLSPGQTLELGRELSVTHNSPRESFWGLMQIAQFERKKGLDATHTLDLAKGARQRLGRNEWDYAEKVIAQAERMKMEGDSVPDSDYFEIMDRTRTELANAKEPWKKFLYARDVVALQVANGFYSTRSFEVAEARASSIADVPLQAQYLLDLAKLAAKAGMNSRYYTDKARGLVYQKMIKSYRVDEMFQKITKAEVEIATTLINRCYPTLIRLDKAKMEQFTAEAVRLNDKDCLRALGAFLPVDIQDKFASQKTEEFFLAGRAMRGIW